MPLLLEWKAAREEWVETQADRSWVTPPNSVYSQSASGPVVFHYWVDRSGRVRMYSDEQLARLSILMRLNLDLHELSTTLGAVRTLDEPMVKSLMQQSYARVGKDADSVLAHLIQLNDRCAGRHFR